jgi:transaldolase
MEAAMAIYLDSAIPDEARQAMSLGYVRGITTNPTLLARVNRPGVEVLRELCRICDGTVFYQLNAPTVSERREEAEYVLSLNEELRRKHDEALAQLEAALAKGEEGEPAPFGRVGLKIPATAENMSLVSHFADRGETVAVTAVFNCAQAYAACEAGATYLLPYVNRMTRLRGDGIAFVRELVQVCQAVDRGTEVLAASIKTPQEAVSTLLAGARHVSMPLAIIVAMGHDPLSEQAIADFAQGVSSRMSR